MQNLMVLLQDSQGNPIQFSSMIQLNRAQLQLFAVNTQITSPKVGTYKIAATNSKKKTKTLSFQVENQATPVITDCPITMSFRYSNHLTKHYNRSRCLDKS